MSDDYAYFTDQELAETPKERMARLAAAKNAVLVNGKCSRCGKEMKQRGFHFHAKACK